MNSRRPVAATLEVLRERLTAGASQIWPDASVVIGHPSCIPPVCLALNLFVVQLRETAVARVATRPDRPSATEADILISAHAPIERAPDGVALLEFAAGSLLEAPMVTVGTPAVQVEVLLQPAQWGALAELWAALGVPLQPSILCMVRLGGRGGEMR